MDTKVIAKASAGTKSFKYQKFLGNHVSYVLQINTNIKFTIKYTPFSTPHVLERDALR
jgi:hypothetical protein